jgi:kynurenine formamidase
VTGAVGSAIDARVDTLARELSNWGRWGDSDQLGTLNLITPEDRLRAAACVKSGTVLSLAIEFRPDLPQPPGSGRLNPQHMMSVTGSDVAARGQVAGFADDILAMSVHGATHWDALSHVFHRGSMFNGHPCTEVTSAGARVNDIVAMSDRLVARGVLVDVARHHGLDALAPDHEVTIEDLESALDDQRVELGRGDVLVVRTGQLGRIAASGDWQSFAEVDGSTPLEPGIGVDCLPWLHDKGVAAIACDNWALEHLHAGSAGRFPVHQVGIVHMGLPLGEIFQLDALAAACAGDGRYDFLLAAGPLPIRRAVGGPVNPIAIR